MSKFWSHFGKHPSFIQVGLLLSMLASGIAQGQSSPRSATLGTRMPASYVPDDDVIIKPVDNELSFYQRYVKSDTNTDVVLWRNQIKVWSNNQVFAQQYGMDSSLQGSAFYVPTPAEKWSYFKDKYMGYLRAKGEQPLKNVPQQWYNDYRASNQVDTINELEARFKTANGKKTNSALPTILQTKEVSLWKQTRFIVQPRVEQGLMILGFKTPSVYLRSWVGINGKVEVNLQQRYESIGLSGMYNYDATSGKYFNSIDQLIAPNLYARYTHSQATHISRRDDSYMFLYARQF